MIAQPLTSVDSDKPSPPRRPTMTESDIDRHLSNVVSHDSCRKLQQQCKAQSLSEHRMKGKWIDSGYTYLSNAILKCWSFNKSHDLKNNYWTHINTPSSMLIWNVNNMRVWALSRHVSPKVIVTQRTEPKPWQLINIKTIVDWRFSEIPFHWCLSRKTKLLSRWRRDQNNWKNCPHGFSFSWLITQSVPSRDRLLPCQNEF
jgi:hypothetical protein